jgi:hypothetical protein
MVQAPLAGCGSDYNVADNFKRGLKRGGDRSQDKAMARIRELQYKPVVQARTQ